MPPDDFFDDDWEEPSRTQDTAIGRPAGEPVERPRGGAPPPPEGPPKRTPRPQPRRKPQRRGPQMPKMPNMPKMPKIPGVSGGDATLPPLEYRRLAALGAGILVVVIVLVFVARGCSGSSAKSANETYVGNLTTQVLKPSDAVAQSFHKTLDLPRAHLAQLKQRIAAQVAAMRKVRENAVALKPTKQLAPYQSGLLDALQFRITGLQCFSGAARGGVGREEAARGRGAALDRASASCTRPTTSTPSCSQTARTPPSSRSGPPVCPRRSSWRRPTSIWSRPPASAWRCSGCTPAP